MGTSTPGGFNQISAGYMKPDDPEFDRGNCSSLRKHVDELHGGLSDAAVHEHGCAPLASDWRIAGIVNARSGAWLSVTQSINRDTAGTGIQGQSGQPVNKVLDNPYGDKTLTNYLNPAAFALPELGTLGDAGFFKVEGPGFWTADIALTRIIAIGAARKTSSSGWRHLMCSTTSTGAIRRRRWIRRRSARFTTQAGDPRILQFGIKYGF